MLPRAYFAREILTAKDAPESLRLLESLDPAKSVIVVGSVDAVQPAADAAATIASGGEQAYRVRYRTAGPALLKLSVPNFPGWQATVDGRPCAIVTADYALMGIVVPAGEKDLLLQFHSNYFGAGAAVSAGSAILALCILLWPAVRHRFGNAP